MKVVDCEKTVKLLEGMKKFFPGRGGALPPKFLTKENIDQVIQSILDHAIDYNTLVYVVDKDQKGDLIPISVQEDLGISAQCLGGGIVVFKNRNFPCDHFDITLIEREEESMAKSKFELGRLTITNAIYEQMLSDSNFASFVYRSLSRYTNADWGDTCDEDKVSNGEALKNWQSRIHSVYIFHKEKEDLPIWIITEWDRSATTILFPEKY